MNDFNLNSVGLAHRLPSPQIIHPAPAPSVWSFQMEPGPQYTSSMGVGKDKAVRAFRLAKM